MFCLGARLCHISLLGERVLPFVFPAVASLAKRSGKISFQLSVRLAITFFVCTQPETAIR